MIDSYRTTENKRDDTAATAIRNKITMRSSDATFRRVSSVAIVGAQGGAAQRTAAP